MIFAGNGKRSGTTLRWGAAAFGNHEFMISAAYGYSLAMVSSDGKDWREVAHPCGGLLALAHGNGLFVAVGANNAWPRGSPDGARWQPPWGERRRVTDWARPGVVHPTPAPPHARGPRSQIQIRIDPVSERSAARMPRGEVEGLNTFRNFLGREGMCSAAQECRAAQAVVRRGGFAHRPEVLTPIPP